MKHKFKMLLLVGMLSIFMTGTVYGSTSDIELTRYNEGISIKSDLGLESYSMQLTIELTSDIDVDDFVFPDFEQDILGEYVDRGTVIDIYLDNNIGYIGSDEVGFLKYDNPSISDIQSISIKTVNYNLETTEYTVNIVEGEAVDDDFLGDDYYNTGSSSSSNKKPSSTEEVEDILKEMKFLDIKEEAWYYSYVSKAFQLGLMAGTSETTFKPEDNATRAMIATVMYNMFADGASAENSIFTDLEDGAWYIEYVNWANNMGIVSGDGTGKFNPNANITRQDLVTILYNASNKFVENNVSTTNKDYTEFKDFDSISEYAVEPIKWAIDMGIISGDTNKNINPKNNATRAEIATILVLFTEAIAE